MFLKLSIFNNNNNIYAYSPISNAVKWTSLRYCRSMFSTALCGRMVKLGLHVIHYYYPLNITKLYLEYRIYLMVGDRYTFMILSWPGIEPRSLKPLRRGSKELVSQRSSWAIHPIFLESEYRDRINTTLIEQKLCKKVILSIVVTWSTKTAFG